jgi:hypothetical protein
MATRPTTDNSGYYRPKAATTGNYSSPNTANLDSFYRPEYLAGLRSRAAAGKAGKVAKPKKVKPLRGKRIAPGLRDPWRGLGVSHRTF